jgi:hypothetical protein
MLREGREGVKVGCEWEGLRFRMGVKSLVCQIFVFKCGAGLTQVGQNRISTQNGLNQAIRRGGGNTGGEAAFLIAVGGSVEAVVGVAG